MSHFIKLTSFAMLSANKMFDLPVMAYMAQDEQSHQLREFLITLGADSLNTDAKPDITADADDLVGCLECVAKLTSDADMEMTLNSIVSLVIAVSRDETGSAVVQKFCDKLQSDTFKGRDLTVLHVLRNLFYGFNGASQLQFKIYCAMLTLAARSGAVRSVITDLTQVKLWLDQWALSVEDRRKCLRLLHAALSKSQQADELARVMFELLSTYTTDSDALTAQADARECVRAALCDPGTLLFDHLLALKPVQALASDATGEGKRLHELLNVFVDGRLADFEAWCAREPKSAETLPIQTLTDKIRVLTLSSVCENRTEVPMSEIASAVKLQLGDELDEFIIKAMRTKAIRAKIDQINNRLIVGGVKNRQFSLTGWEQLKHKLDTWSNSLRQVKFYMEKVATVQ